VVICFEGFVKTVLSEIVRFSLKVKQSLHFNVFLLPLSLQCLDLLWFLAQTWFTSLLACGGV